MNISILKHIGTFLGIFVNIVSKQERFQEMWISVSKKVYFHCIMSVMQKYLLLSNIPSFMKYQGFKLEKFSFPIIKES